MAYTLACHMSLTVPAKEKLKRSFREAWMTLYFCCCFCCCCCCCLLFLLSVVVDDDAFAYNNVFRPPLMALRSAPLKEGVDGRSDEKEDESMTGVVSVANNDTDAPESVFALKNKSTLAINNNRKDHLEFTGIDFDNESSIEKSFLYLDDLFLRVLLVSLAFRSLDECVRQAVSGKRMAYSSR